jgi:hypothetical protein
MLVFKDVGWLLNCKHPCQRDKYSILTKLPKPELVFKLNSVSSPTVREGALAYARATDTLL